jgi:Domain of unknown function (DUF397)
MMATQLDHVLPWRKSRYSNGGDNCVEWVPGPHGIMLRDSKDPDGPTITLGRDQWARFLADVLSGRCAGTGAVRISTEECWRTYGGVPKLTVWHLYCRSTGGSLHFTAGERDAFLGEARDGELDMDRALATH